MPLPAREDSCVGPASAVRHRAFALPTRPLTDEAVAVGEHQRALSCNLPVQKVAGVDTARARHSVLALPAWKKRAWRLRRPFPLISVGKGQFVCPSLFRRPHRLQFLHIEALWCCLLLCSSAACARGQRRAHLRVPSGNAASFGQRAAGFDQRAASCAL
eukprot:3463209-Rhodomonas_salina.1